MQAEAETLAATEEDSSASDSESQHSDCLLDELALSEEWAREIILTEGEPTEVRVESRAGVAGALSRVVAVAIRYELNGEHLNLPVVVKYPPRDPFGRLFFAEAQFDTREILFYTKVAPVLNQLARETLGEEYSLSIPRCLKAKLAEELGGDSELVLEDATASGYAAADFADGLCERRAAAALATAARLHALSLALREREGALDRTFDFLFPSERAAAGYLRLIRRGLPELEGFLCAQNDFAEETDAVIALRARAPGLLQALLKPAEPALLVHADFWSGNLMFREREDRCECIALDWQMVSLGRPMDDVALLILSSLSPETRRAAGERLIEDYGRTLEEECAKAGAAAVGAEVRAGLKADWPRAALRALLLCAGSVTVAMNDPRAEARLLQAVKDLHREGILAFQPES